MSEEGNGVISREVLDLIDRYVPDDSYVRVLYFLAMEPCCQGVLRVLQYVEDKERVFREMVDELIQDTKRLKEDRKYLAVMADLWNYLKSKYTDLQVTPFDARQLQEMLKEGVLLPATLSFLKAIAENALAIVPKVLICIRRQKEAADAGKNYLAGTSVIASTLSLEAYKSVRSWWKDEISGERCVKSLTDYLATTAAGVAGGLGGAAIGTLFLPGIGTIIGAVVGGVAAANLAALISDWLTRTLFGLPKEVAMQNAFRFLRLDHSASNDEINSRYHELKKQYNPDIGGNRADRAKLDHCMGVIKASREVGQKLKSN